MFRPDVRVTPGRSAFAVLELIFHASVRHIRKSHGNAIIGLLLSIVKSLIMVAVFVFMFEIMGTRSSAVRGDFLLYIMTGIFNFMTHAAAIGAVAGSDGPTSAMMKHSPMNTVVAISAAALGSLYLQTLSALSILFFYHTLWTPITIFEPLGVAACFLLSWASGVGVGMIFKAATPWQPEFFGIASTIYARANMIFSGKMFLANATPTSMLVMFTWNPLFHCIDQTRGFMFENYHPHYSNLTYPIVVTLVLIFLGLLFENYTRKHASASWSAKR
jgi:ABC-type polysaccharide/polyol phosphate export permease